jgi:hypothetical protein
LSSCITVPIFASFPYLRKRSLSMKTNLGPQHGFRT